MTETYKRLISQLKALAAQLHEKYGGQATRRELSEVKAHLKSLNNTIRSLFEELNGKIEEIDGRLYELEENQKD